MNKFLSILLIIALVAGCKSKSLLSTSVDGWDGKRKSLESNWQEKEFMPKEFQLKASASLKQDGKQTPFRIEVRMKRDSLIWLSFSDPILGIPLVRAIILPDSFAMVNKIEKSYMTGDASKIDELFGLSVPFDELQDLFLANFPTRYTLDSVQIVNQEVLAFHPEEQPIDDKLSLMEPMMFLGIWRPASYGINWKGSEDRFKVTYSNYFEQEGNYYPRKWDVQLLSAKPMHLDMKIKDVSFEKAHYPFKIPSSYKLTK